MFCPRRDEAHLMLVMRVKNRLDPGQTSPAMRGFDGAANGMRVSAGGTSRTGVASAWKGVLQRPALPPARVTDAESPFQRGRMKVLRAAHQSTVGGVRAARGSGLGAH